MPAEEQPERGTDTPETARTVGQLVKYSREVNQSDTVDEVGTYALEATYHVLDGNPDATVVEARRGELTVLESTFPDVDAGDEPGDIVRRAYDAEQTVVVAADGVAVTHAAEEIQVVAPDEVSGAGGSDVTVAAPSLQADENGEVGVILVARWPTLERVEEHHVRPLEYFADHVATAIHNIRSQERLERARTDLAKRKEMIEVYDRLLRHDLGNDLQVISGFSDALVSLVEDGQPTEYAEKIQRTARSASDLIGRVGDLVQTLEESGEPEPRPLEPIVAGAVEDAETKFDSLTVKYDPDEFRYQVFAGDLLGSIFDNVLSNAAVHNAGPVTVEVYAEEPAPETVVVGFADDGAGVDESLRENIFEMGEKGPDSDGSGVGLGLARALAESYGGDVAVRESDRGGADFRVTLDRA